MLRQAEDNPILFILQDFKLFRTSLLYADGSTWHNLLSFLRSQVRLLLCYVTDFQSATFWEDMLKGTGNRDKGKRCC